MIDRVAPFITDTFIQNFIFTTPGTDSGSKFARRVSIRVIAMISTPYILQCVPAHGKKMLWFLVLACSLFHFSVMMEQKKEGMQKERLR